MHSVNIDYDIKLIHLTVSGCVGREEFLDIMNELSDSFSKFQKEKALLMVSAQKCDTLPQDSVQVFAATTELCLKHAEKLQRFMVGP